MAVINERDDEAGSAKLEDIGAKNSVSERRIAGSTRTADGIPGARGARNSASAP
jgi:hypothetical protein